MKLFFRIALGTIASALLIGGLLMMNSAFDGPGSDAAGRGLAQGLGVLLAIVGAAAGGALFLSKLWRGWLVIAGIILSVPLVLIAVFTIGSEIHGARARSEAADIHSGRFDFSEQPNLLAMAEAISKNDEAAMRVAAKNIPDLQASGRDGMTLLYFAVNEALERPELTRAVEILLSLGAQPNFTNGDPHSFAMARSVHGPVRLLRAMLEAGGNANARDDQGKPIVFDNWQTTYFENEQGARLNLLLEHGADLNAIWPDSEPGYAGYSLAMFRASMGRGDGQGFADALILVQRGADFRHATKEGITLASILQEDARWFQRQREGAPPSFAPLIQWLREQGVAVEE